MEGSNSTCMQVEGEVNELVCMQKARAGSIAGTWSLMEGTVGPSSPGLPGRHLALVTQPHCGVCPASSSSQPAVW